MDLAVDVDGQVIFIELILVASGRQRSRLAHGAGQADEQPAHVIDVAG
jgi:hypothetical protein